MKALDESGIVGITCSHCANFMFLNINGGGKRQSHSISLMEVVLHEVRHFAELKLCHDIA
jgi:hypothetical protein